MARQEEGVEDEDPDESCDVRGNLLAESEDYEVGGLEGDLAGCLGGEIFGPGEVGENLGTEVGVGVFMGGSG